MNSSHQIHLSDGRSLGYAEFGSANGFPILFFHGLPGCRFEAEKFHDAAIEMNVRLIGIDRPGMGLSSPQKNRTIITWANDITEFSDLLNLEKFSIIGHSGGAPYVAACAYKLAVHKAVIVSGIAPLTYQDAISSLNKNQKLIFWITRYCPFLLKWMMKLSLTALQNPKKLNNMIKQLSEADKKIFANIGYRDAMIASLKEAFRQGAVGVVNDFKSIIKPWQFDLKDIQCPFVIWQGGEDHQAPVKHAEIYAKHVPAAKFNFLKEEGHISILYHYNEEILRSAL